ncbi:MAG: helix-turn-helix transcriptional regulator [Selenomonadaceae bacterium]|nr:helix-turn-helix transcriptional regulator [Selenomonadaceae bacterium]
MQTTNKEQRLRDIGVRLRDFRKGLGFKNQENFASELGMKRSAYSHYELGESEPTGAFLHNLSTKFGADINYILTGKSEQEMPDFDTYLSRMGVDDMMKAIVKGYMALSPEKRKAVKEYIESLAAEIAARKAAPVPQEEIAEGEEKRREPPESKNVSDSDTSIPESASDNHTEEEKEIINQLRLEKSMKVTTASRSIA